MLAALSGTPARCSKLRPVVLAQNRTGAETGRWHLASAQLLLQGSAGPWPFIRVGKRQGRRTQNARAFRFPPHAGDAALMRAPVFSIACCRFQSCCSGRYHQRHRRPWGPHQQWRRGPQPHRRPPLQPGPRGGPRWGGTRWGWASISVVDNAMPKLSATTQHDASRINWRRPVIACNLSLSENRNSLAASRRW